MPIVSPPAVEFSRPRGLTLGVGGLDKGIALCSLLRQGAAFQAPDLTRRSTQRLGICSIAAVFVISAFGRDLFRIPDRSLALLEMTVGLVSIVLLFEGARGGFRLAGTIAT